MCQYMRVAKCHRKRSRSWGDRQERREKMAVLRKTGAHATCRHVGHRPGCSASFVVAGRCPKTSSVLPLIDGANWKWGREARRYQVRSVRLGAMADAVTAARRTLR